MNKSGIYIIINIFTDQFYIGSAANLRHRIDKHFQALKLDRHFNTRLQNAWNKYGSDVFQFAILEYCDKNKTLEREQYWFNITGYEMRYNSDRFAGSPLGRKVTEETKNKISASVSKAQVGRKLSSDHKANIAAAIKKIGISPEKRAKMIAGLRNKYLDAEKVLK